MSGFIQRVQVLMDANDSDQVLELIWEYQEVLQAAGELDTAKNLLLHMNIYPVTDRWMQILNL